MKEVKPAQCHIETHRWCKCNYGMKQEGHIWIEFLHPSEEATKTHHISNGVQKYVLDPEVRETHTLKLPD